VLWKTVLSSDRIKQLVESDATLATFKADTTVASSAAAAYLKELGMTAIPLIVVDGPGVPKPLMADTYTADSLVTMIEQARGTAGL
jgi:thiol:disulfide interchange protein